ncbi:hypothetical protein B6S44_21280 [Bosea sp. Tri-44]|uniref:hypothetical protein n=1 Tax=Bosea sp. Tri-44 TaxID=1972137 RepID=UPI00100E5622|nr:hypothetical protein [Bosea sp. Tri-44]RXT51421.1 hypothetical protein B6S44_21280 [Bosea sp. Tri-44]
MLRTAALREKLQSGAQIQVWATDLELETRAPDIMPALIAVAEDGRYGRYNPTGAAGNDRAYSISLGFPMDEAT